MATKTEDAALAVVSSPRKWSLPTAIPSLPSPKFHIPNIFSHKPPKDLKKTLKTAMSQCIHNMENTFHNAFPKHHPIVQCLTSVHQQYHDAVQGFMMERRKIVSVTCCNRFAAILPGDSVAAMVVSNGLSNFLNLYNTVLVVRLVLTWFPNAPPALVSPLSTICDPYLNIFRGIIPPIGGSIDLSPILAFVVLNAVTSTATALPAEMPKNSEIATFDASISSECAHPSVRQNNYLKKKGFGNWRSSKPDRRHQGVSNN